MNEFERLLSSWEQIANREGQPTVNVTRSSLKDLLAAVRVEVNRTEPT